MAEERVRRRRGRRRRRGAGGGSAAQAESEGATQPTAPGWHWRTFPVFFAFVVGGFLILLIGPQPNTSLYAILFFGFLGATAYGVAHIITRTLIARRRR